MRACTLPAIITLSTKPKAFPSGTMILRQRIWFPYGF